jgi:hypothetical protein
MKSILAFAIAVTALAIVAPAHADTGEICTVTNTGWGDNSGQTSDPGKQLYIVCQDNQNIAYIAQNTNASGQSCPLYSIDTIKLWMSQANAALLSGRTLVVWWDTFSNCGGARTIVAIENQ